MKNRIDVFYQKALAYFRGRVDPQKGKANAEDRFLSAFDGCTEYARIDNLKLSNLIRYCVEE